MKKKLHIFLIPVIAIVFIVVLGVFVSRGLAKNFVLEGVYFAEISLSRMSYSEVEKVVNDTYDQMLDSPVKVKVDNLERAVDLRDLGAWFDTKRTVEGIYRFSYSDDLLSHLTKRFDAWRGGEFRIKPVFSLDRNKLEKAVREAFPEIQPARDAEIHTDSAGNVQIMAHEDGIAVDLDFLYAGLKDNLIEFNVPEEIEAQAVVMKADYTSKQAETDTNVMAWFFRHDIVFSHAPLQYEHEVKFQPDWITVRKGNIAFRRDAIADYLQKNIAPMIDIVKQDMMIAGLPEGEVGRVEITGEKKDGRMVNIAISVDGITRSFGQYDFLVDLSVVETKGNIVTADGMNLGDMVLLAEGRSNFNNSPAARRFNIERGLKEKMNNILISPGATFDFNYFLDGPVTKESGWLNALAIFNGEDLKPVPGGGICQVSTTVYRAALNAGLEILEQRNHSLWVVYYKEHGNGLDATIYPGQQNLKFVNNTGNYILMTARTEGDDAYVHLYGTSDGRQVVLSGPVYGSNKITWIQQISWPNGQNEAKKLVSVYKKGYQR